MNLRLKGRHMTQGEDIIRLSHEIESMPEFALEQKLYTLDVSLYVFNKNYQELKQYPQMTKNGLKR